MASEGQNIENKENKENNNNDIVLEVKEDEKVPSIEETMAGSHQYQRGVVALKHFSKEDREGRLNTQSRKMYDHLRVEFNKRKRESIRNTTMGISSFSETEGGEADPFSIRNMPHDIQVGFRKKVFIIFNAQLLMASIISGVLRYTPSIYNEYFKVYEKDTAGVAQIFIGLLLSLLLLFSLKYSYPWNFLALAIFTFLQSIFFTAMSALWYNTHSSLFILLLTFLTMVLTGIFASKTIITENGTPGFYKMKVVFFSSMAASYILGTVVYIIVLRDFMPVTHFLSSMGFVTVVCLWFAYDSSCMETKMSADEYMQGVIFFYTDMILFVIFLALLVAASVLCGNGGGGNCTGCFCAYNIDGGGGGVDGDEVNGFDDIQESADT